MFSNIKALIWDLDNTITDSREAHFQAWELVTKKYNVPHDRDFFEQHYGRSNLELLSQELGDYVKSEKAAIISDEKEIEFRNFIKEEPVKILPGVMDWLVYGKDKAIVQGLASSSPMQNIVAQIQSVELGDFFNIIVTGSPLKQGKPHPQIFLNAAAGLEIQPEHCLVIEDTLHGIEAALRGNMYCILVRDVTKEENEIIKNLEDTYATQKNQYICIKSLAENAPSTMLV